MITNKNTNTKYSISQLMYPNDLMDPIYGGNMAVFFINVANASRFQPNPNQTIDMSKLDTPSMRGLTIGRNISLLNATLSAGGFSNLAVAGSVIGAVASGSVSNIFGVIAGGGIAGAVALGVAGKIAATTTREQKRLTSAIALHMPNSLSIRYAVEWGSEDMIGAEMISKLLEEGTAAAKSLSETNISSMVDAVKKTTVDGLVNSTLGAGIANVGLSTAPGGAYMSARSGLAANPRKEMVFKGVDFRTFTFDYQFFPRSEDEAKNVEEIINTFKFHMHPEYKDTDSFLYLYPSEFDITYYTREGENRHIHRHTSCVLTELNISYAPQGNFNVFANGMPTQINITLSFKELAIPTKESIKDQGL